VDIVIHALSVVTVPKAVPMTVGLGSSEEGLFREGWLVDLGRARVPGERDDGEF